VGRFVGEDSKKDGPNWFCYAGGNPSNLLDYDGNNAWGWAAGGWYFAFLAVICAAGTLNAITGWLESPVLAEFSQTLVFFAIAVYMFAQALDEHGSGRSVFSTVAAVAGIFGTIGATAASNFLREAGKLNSFGPAATAAGAAIVGWAAMTTAALLLDG
jgi:hypothetical protein